MKYDHKGQAPAIQFYVRDWLSDPQLRMCSHSTKGIWIDILCLMWEATERGRLQGTVDQFCKMLSATQSDFEQFIQEANVTNFANVTKCNNHVTVENRRMIRDEKIRNDTRLRVQRHRSNAKCNAPVTPPSSSSSSCTKVQRGKTARKIALPDWLEEGIWEDFKEHRKKLRKPMTLKAEEILIAKLDHLRKEGHNPKHLIITAIERGWQSVFPPGGNG